MDCSPITAWLRKKAAADAALSFLSGALILTGGTVVVAVSFGAAYVLVSVVSRLGVTSICAVFSDHPVQLSNAVHLTAAVLMVGALFVGNAWLRREYSRAPARRHAAAGLERHSPEAVVHLLAYPGTSSRSSSDLLFTGPRLMTLGRDHIRKAARLWRMDLEACSSFLCILASRNSKVTLVEASQALGIPNAHTVLPQLADINGIVFLNDEPPGLRLTVELRRELNDLIGMSVPFAAVYEVQSAARPATTNLHELLGLSPTASLAEFEIAYRKWIRETARTGPMGIRQPLDQNAEAVKGAYEAFLRQHERRHSEEARHKVERIWEQYKRSGK